MDIYFLFVQSLGIIAWLILVASYYRKDTNKILVFQTIATALYCLHYYLLGAYSGLFICFFEVVRDYLYYKTDWDDYIFYSSIPVYVIYGIIGFGSFVDLLPIGSSIIDGYSLTKKRDAVVIWAIISYTLWVIYDLFVMSYSCALTDGLVVLSNVLILIRESKTTNKHIENVAKVRKVSTRKKQ